MEDLSGGLAGVTVLFSLVLALSVLIERILEMTKSFYDLMDGHYDFHRYWSRQAMRFRDKAERKLRIFEFVDPEQAAPVLHRFSEMLLNHQGGYAGTVPILSGDLVRALYVKVVSKFLAISLGIFVAFWRGIDLVVLWQGKPMPLENISVGNVIISGMVIGLGTPVVHKVITTIEKRQKKMAEGSKKP